MRFTVLAPLCLAFFSALAPIAPAQSLHNDEFRLTYSSSGITSLKRVQDKYDTDYIAQGRALGDVLIRYHASGETDWKKASAAFPDPENSPSDHAVHLRRSGCRHRKRCVRHI